MESRHPSSPAPPVLILTGGVIQHRADSTTSNDRARAAKSISSGFVMTLRVTTLALETRRTAALTSTTRTAITMTTEDSGDFAVLFLGTETRHGGRTAAVARLSAAFSPPVVAGGFSSAAAILWTRPPQRNSALVRKKGFWLLSPDKAAQFPPETRTDNLVVDSVAGPRFLATAHLPPTDLDVALDAVLAHHRCAGVVLLGRGEISPAMSSLLESALHNAKFELELAQLLVDACEREGVVAMVPTGRFDDRETGVYVCAPTHWEASVPGLVPDR